MRLEQRFSAAGIGSEIQPDDRRPSGGDRLLQGSGDARNPRRLQAHECRCDAAKLKKLSTPQARHDRSVNRFNLDELSSPRLSCGVWHSRLPELKRLENPPSNKQVWSQAFFSPTMIDCL